MKRRPTFAWKPVAVVTVALAVVLLVLAPAYGPHRDELYFASAGHRLAWGYPDQPSMVALIARVTQDLAGHSLLALRTPSVLAVCASLVMSVGLVRLLGGGARAQVLMAVVFASSGVVLAFGHLLETGTMSFLAWTALALVAAHALVDDRPRLWLLAGLVAGLGLNAKHDMVVALLGLFVGVAATPAVRHHLRSPWWWAGGGVALLLWLPNLVWQAQHGWPVFVLSGEIRDEYGGAGGAVQYLVLTLLIFSPLLAAVWIAGLVGLLRRTEWAWARPLAWIFLVTFGFFLVTGGKAYYVAGAIPPLLAAGTVMTVQRFRRLVPIGVALVLSAAVAWPAVLPVLPARTYAASGYPALSDTGIESIGWPEYVASVRRALAPLPKGAVVFTGNYGEAGALEWYGVPARVYSGHNGWADFGPPPDGAGPVVVVGYRDPTRRLHRLPARGHGADRRRRGQRGARRRHLRLHRAEGAVVAGVGEARAPRRLRSVQLPGRGVPLGDAEQPVVRGPEDGPELLDLDHHCPQPDQSRDLCLAIGRGQVRVGGDVATVADPLDQQPQRQVVGPREVGELRAPGRPARDGVQGPGPERDLLLQGRRRDVEADLVEQGGVRAPVDRGRPDGLVAGHDAEGQPARGAQHDDVVVPLDDAGPAGDQVALQAGHVSVQVEVHRGSTGVEPLHPPARIGPVGQQGRELTVVTAPRREPGAGRGGPELRADLEGLRRHVQEAGQPGDLSHRRRPTPGR